MDRRYILVAGIRIYLTSLQGRFYDIVAKGNGAGQVVRNKETGTLYPIYENLSLPIKQENCGKHIEWEGDEDKDDWK